MKKVTLPVAALEVCDRVRVRKQKPKGGSEIIQEYAEAYQCGQIVDPLHVFQEKGTERYIVADGEHRLLALQRAGIKEVEVALHSGDEIEALDFAADCNHAHGVRLREQDRYHILCRIMETPLRDKYRTDTDLSEKLRVSKKTVQRYRARWRDEDAKDATTKKLKKQEKTRAAKFTSTGKEKENIPKVDTVSTSAQCETPAKKPAKPTLTPQQKQVAKQVRESVKPTWTAADEHAYKCLMTAWSRSTGPACEKFLATIRERAAA